MSKAKTIFIFGVIIVVLPYFGLSNSVEKIVMLIIGLSLIMIAYGIYFKHKAKNKSPKQQETFAEVPQPKMKEEMTGFTFINPSTRETSGERGKNGGNDLP